MHVFGPTCFIGRIIDTETPCHPLTLLSSSCSLLSAPLFFPSCSRWPSCWPSGSLVCSCISSPNYRLSYEYHIELTHTNCELTDPLSSSRLLDLSRHPVPYSVGPGSVGGRGELWGHAPAHIPTAVGTAPHPMSGAWGAAGLRIISVYCIDCGFLLAYLASLCGGVPLI